MTDQIKIIEHERDAFLSINLNALENLPTETKAKILTALVPGDILVAFIESLVATTDRSCQIQEELGIDYTLWTYTVDTLRSRLTPMLEPMFREECENLQRMTRNSEKLREAAASLAHTSVTGYWMDLIIDKLCALKNAYSNGQQPLSSSDFRRQFTAAFREWDALQQREDSSNA